MNQTTQTPPSLAQAVFVGMTAGVGTALLSGLLTPGVAPVVFLSLIAPVPLFIAGFGWHPLVAVLGGLTAALVTNIAVGTTASLVVFGMLAVPAFGLAMITERRFGDYTARPERDGIELGRLVVTLVLYIAITGVVAALVVEPDFDALQRRIRKSVEAAFQLVNARSPVPGGADLAPLFDMLTGIMLPMSALLAIGTIIVSGVIGVAITERSGRLTFARPDLRRLRLPGGALILAGIAFLVGIRSGYVGLLGEIVALGLCLGFLLQGLAVIHVRTLGMSGRGFTLAAIWATLVIFGIPGLILILIGMADHLFDFRRGRL